MKAEEPRAMMNEAAEKMVGRDLMLLNWLLSLERTILKGVVKLRSG